MRFISVLFFSVFFSAQSSWGLATDGVSLLKELVETSSGSFNPEGVTKAQKIFSDHLESLGFKIATIPSQDSKHGPLMTASLPGTSAKFITLIFHADTVFEKFSGFEGFHVSSDGKTANGPGVIDDKGGMVVAYFGLKDFLTRNKIPKYSLRIVSSPSEEVGSPGFVENFKKYSEDSVLILGLEPCLEGGSVVDSRRGNRWYKIKVVGREAHSGRDHTQGINACWELSKKLDALSQLTDYKKGLTVSIGHFEGGKDKFNVVCGEASAKLDVRFSNFAIRDEAHQKILKIIGKNSVSSFTDHKLVESSFEIEDDSPPFSPTKKALTKIEQIKKLIKKYEGISVSSGISGGTADSNEFSRPDLPIIDGLGACGSKMHTKDEYVEISSLKSRAQVLSDLLDLENQ